MTSIQPAQVLDAFLSTLGVDADALQVLRRRARDEAQVPPAQDAERLERLGRVGLVVVEVVGPLILVVAGNHRPILRQDEAHAPRPHHLGVGQVPEHLRDRPLARHLALFQLARRHSVDRLPQGCRCVREDAHRVPRAEQFDDGSDVSGRLFRGTARWIGEYRHRGLYAPLTVSRAARAGMDAARWQMTEYALIQCLLRPHGAEPPA